MDIERQRCVDAFRELGLEDADSYFGDYAQTGIFMAVEDGSASVSDFHAVLRSKLPAGTKDAQIDRAFNQFLIGIPEHRLKALRELRRRGYGIYLLSNTNPIMWKSKIAAEFAKEGLRREDYFDGMVTSFEAKAAKPNRKIFDYAVRILGIKPEETVFFDDSQANTDAAEALGFKAVHVVPGTEFMDYIDK